MSGPVVLAKLTSKPGRRDELMTTLQKLVDAVEQEPGTLSYLLHHDVNDGDTVWFYETYESQEAFDAHGKSATMKAIGPELGEVLNGPPELKFLTLIGGKGR